MKKAIVGVIAAMMMVTPVTANERSIQAVQAAQADSAQLQAVITNVPVMVEGRENTLRAVKVKDQQLYALNDLAKAIQAQLSWDSASKTIRLVKGAKTIELQLNQATAKVNGNEKELSTPLTMVQNQAFIDLHSLLGLLDGEAFEEGNGSLHISLFKMLEGYNINPRWISPTSLLIQHETEDGMQDYYFSTISKAFTPINLTDVTASELVVSPKGDYAAFVNDRGHVYTIHLYSQEIKQVSTDDQVKTELQWSADGAKLIYLQGEKSNVIAEMNVADGKVTKIVDDKVDFKSDVRISPDGTKILYTVVKGGKVTLDEKTNEVTKVDSAGTEPQLYVFNRTVKDAKPLALTSSKDEKVFADWVNVDQIIYVSVDVEDEAKLPIIKLIQANGKETKDIVTHLDIVQVSVAKNNTLLLLGYSASGEKGIYQVDVTNSEVKQLYKVAAETVQMYLAPNKRELALSVATDEGEKIAILVNNQFIFITK